MEGAHVAPPRQDALTERALRRARALERRDDEPPRPARGGRPDPARAGSPRPSRRQARADGRRCASLDRVDERSGPPGGPRRVRADEARADAAELAAAEADARV